MDRETRKKQRIKQLLHLCHFYNGEVSCPSFYSKKQQICWQYETEWAELLADSFTNRDKLVNYMENRLSKTNVMLHQEISMPKSLLAYIIYKCDNSNFVHEWIGNFYELLSGTYTNKHWSQLKI
jgi:hypothetical protein